MTGEINIILEKIDDRHQRYTIPSNMNGRRSMHQEIPKKNNVRFTDKKGPP